MKEFYRLCLPPNNLIDSIPFFRNIDNFINFKKCFQIIDCKDFTFNKNKKYCDYQTIDDIFVYFCKMGYEYEVGLLLSFGMPQFPKYIHKRRLSERTWGKGFIECARYKHYMILQNLF